jgi:NADH-quinone oxidoreductase subunit A
MRLREVGRARGIESTHAGRASMLGEFVGVLAILVLALVVSSGMAIAPKLLGPRRVFDEKQDPFECGEKQIASPHQRFSVKFYLVAMLFVLFDLEAVFFYPWGALFRDLGTYGLAAMAVFTVPLVIGLVYEWRKGALEW